MAENNAEPDNAEPNIEQARLRLSDDEAFVQGVQRRREDPAFREVMVQAAVLLQEDRRQAATSEQQEALKVLDRLFQLGDTGWPDPALDRLADLAYSMYKSVGDEAEARRNVEHASEIAGEKAAREAQAERQRAERAARIEERATRREAEERRPRQSVEEIKKRVGAQRFSLSDSQDIGRHAAAAGIMQWPPSREEKELIVGKPGDVIERIESVKKAQNESIPPGPC